MPACPIREVTDRGDSTKEIIVLTTIATTITPLLGEYIYVGGGLLTLVIIVLVVMFVLRRA